MNMGAIVASVTLADTPAQSLASPQEAARTPRGTRTVAITRTAYVRSTTKAPGVRALLLGAPRGARELRHFAAWTVSRAPEQARIRSRGLLRGRYERSVDRSSQVG